MKIDEFKKMNRESLEKKEMNLVNGGIGNCQQDTMTVTYDTATGDQTVTNDGKDPLDIQQGLRRL